MKCTPRPRSRCRAGQERAAEIRRAYAGDMNRLEPILIVGLRLRAAEWFLRSEREHRGLPVPLVQVTRKPRRRHR